MRVFLVRIEEQPLAVMEPAPLDLGGVPRPPPRAEAGRSLAMVQAFTRRPVWRPPLPAAVPPPPPRASARATLATVQGYVMFGASPFGAAPFGARRDRLSLDIGDVMLRYGTINYVDRDHAEFEDGLRTPSFSRTILTGGTVGGWATASLGDLELDNLEGERSGLLRRVAVDGRPVEVLQPRSDGTTDVVFECTARDIVPGDDDTVRIRLRDWDYLLDRPAQTATYPDDAPPEIANRRRPFGYGPCNNVTPTRIATTAPSYQFNDGPSRALRAVYVAGVPQLPADVAVVDLTASTFTLAAEPAGDVTCDFDGLVVDGVYLNTTALVIDDLAFRRGGLPSARKSVPHFERFAADMPGEVQLYVSHGEEPTVLSLIQRLLAPCGWGAFSWRGQLQVGVWKVATGTPRCLLSKAEGTLIGLQPVELPTEVYPPPWRLRGGYDRNWTPQAASQLKGDDAPGAVDPVGGPERRRWLARAQDIAEAKDEVTRDLLHLGAKDPAVVETCLADRIGCETVLQASLAHWLGNRAHYRVVPDTPPFFFDIGDEVAIQWDGYGLEGGQIGVVAEVAEGEWTELVIEV